MMILLCESTSSSFKGELSRWLIEPKTGVFVGKVSALVRDKLWEKACKQVGNGSVTLIYTSNNEQGFFIKSFGESKRKVVDIDGLFLVKIP